MTARIAQRVAAAQKLLFHCGVLDAHAVICGGYARDTICGKDIRDVDLYVSAEKYRRIELSLFGDGIKRAKGFYPESNEYKHQSIYKQHEADLLPELVTEFGLETNRVNLIGVLSHIELTFDEVTARFNLGICKAGIDYTLGLQVTDEFKVDYKDKQITLFRTDWGHEASLKQWIKLQAKYPWPLRVQPQPEGLFDA